MRLSYENFGCLNDVSLISLILMDVHHAKLIELLHEVLWYAQDQISVLIIELNADASYVGKRLTILAYDLDDGPCAGSSV
jgi:hypothetical protein